MLILPYTHIFQSGVLFLGNSFGLPAMAADVGSLKEEIVVGKTGFICKARDPIDLARAIRDYFSSPLYKALEQRRNEIRGYANDCYSWSRVAEYLDGESMYNSWPIDNRISESQCEF